MSDKQIKKRKLGDDGEEKEEPFNANNANENGSLVYVIRKYSYFPFD